MRLEQQQQIRYRVSAQTASRPHLVGISFARLEFRATADEAREFARQLNAAADTVDPLGRVTGPIANTTPEAGNR